MIDTLALAKRLRQAGDTPEHAEALAEALAVGLNDHVATKSDISALSAKIDAVARTLDAKIDTVASTLNAKIDTVASTLNAKLDGVASALNAKIDGVSSELKATIGGITSDLNARIGSATLRLFVALTAVIGVATVVIVTHFK